MPWILALLLVFVAPVVEQGKPKLCEKCHATGKVPCDKHPASEDALEDEVLYCSVIEGCPTCGGTGFVVCPLCRSEAARKALEDKRASIQKRKAALQEIDDGMGRPLRKAESAHFVFVWEMDKYKIDKRVVSAHEALHIYTARMEKLFADYLATLATDEKQFQDKCRVFVWWLPQDHQQAALKFCGSDSAGGVKLMGLHPRYSICGQKKDFTTDEQLHRNIVHAVTHLLLGHQSPIAWIGNMKGGWADEGLAHWFEDRVSGICDNYCFQEANTNVDFEKGHYRFGVRKMVAKNEEPPIADVTQHNVDTLTVPMNAVVFSYVDYLLTLGGEKFNKLVKELKAKVPASEAIRKIYGFGLLEMETQWKAWVLQTYPTR
jgi:hypothetical protein